MHLFSNNHIQQEAPLPQVQKETQQETWHPFCRFSSLVGLARTSLDIGMCSLEWVQSDSRTVRVCDPLTSVKATATYGDHSHLLTPTSAQWSLIDLFQYQ